MTERKRETKKEYYKYRYYLLKEWEKKIKNKVII